MNIQRKIEEIRRQPEHVRLKYVWGCVAVSMGMVVALWFFSLYASFQKTEQKPLTGGMESLTRNTGVQIQAPSLEEWLKQGQAAPATLEDR
jgi:hypothetical protein